VVSKPRAVQRPRSASEALFPFELRPRQMHLRATHQAKDPGPRA
jgi:hypothetical protein